ncbi:hypothetical protein DFQ27_002055 [Actinomortierella ambigua]|uniref:Cyclin-domain-containing protein n=1 Tax=Actinomortierella ambigua TaxID=1343610 RepID=A0A9P6QAC7_9FUNG|nr:hypothetical protein DFQ26_004202 [Actinomortierella ambigua]KAG0262897.1 hypothetical protein DFQ27_002055 [Actinomortierella ambigua]
MHLHPKAHHVTPSPEPTSRSTPVSFNDPDEVIYVQEFFHLVDMRHLTVMIADMLCRLTAHNDQIPLTSANLTRFHSRAPPDISVYEYLRRIVKYTSLERACLLMILIYIDRVCERVRTFTISSLTVHRFIITAVTLAAKAVCDSYCTNTHYAKVGGLSTQELNSLEVAFLELIDWRVAVEGAVLQRYYVNLVRQHSRFDIMPGQATLPTPHGHHELQQATTSPLSPSTSGAPPPPPPQDTAGHQGGEDDTEDLEDNELQYDGHEPAGEEGVQVVYEEQDYAALLQDQWVPQDEVQ